MGRATIPQRNKGIRRPRKIRPDCIPVTAWLRRRISNQALGSRIPSHTRAAWLRLAPSPWHISNEKSSHLTTFSNLHWLTCWLLSGDRHESAFAQTQDEGRARRSRARTQQARRREVRSVGMRARRNFDDPHVVGRRARSDPLEAQAARDAVLAMSTADREALLAFLGSLCGARSRSATRVECDQGEQRERIEHAAATAAGGRAAARRRRRRGVVARV